MLEISNPSAPIAAAYQFATGERESVIAESITYAGRRFADLRTVYHAPNGQTYRTRRGLRVPLDLLPDLETAVRKLREAVGR